MGDLLTCMRELAIKVTKMLDNVYYLPLIPRITSTAIQKASKGSSGRHYLHIVQHYLVTGSTKRPQETDVYIWAAAIPRELARDLLTERASDTLDGAG